MFQFQHFLVSPVCNFDARQRQHFAQQIIHSASPTGRCQCVDVCFSPSSVQRLVEGRTTAWRNDTRGRQRPPRQSRALSSLGSCRSRPYCVSHTIDACPCRQCNLKWRTCGLHNLAELRAVMVSMVNARVAQGGVVPLAKSSAANTTGTLQDRQGTHATLHLCSVEAFPNGAVRKQSAKIFLSNSKKALGWMFNTSCGISSTSWGPHERPPPKVGERATLLLLDAYLGVDSFANLFRHFVVICLALSLSGQRAN